MGVIGREDANPEIDRSPQQRLGRRRISRGEQKPSLAGGGAGEARVIDAESLLIDGCGLPGQLKSLVEAAFISLEIRQTLEHLGTVRVKLADRSVVDGERLVVRHARTDAVSACVQRSAENQLARGHGGVGPIVDAGVGVQ